MLLQASYLSGGLDVMLHTEEQRHPLWESWQLYRLVQQQEQQQNPFEHHLPQRSLHEHCDVESLLSTRDGRNEINQLRQGARLNPRCSLCKGLQRDVCKEQKSWSCLMLNAFV